jgi:hypothetical protein
MGKEFILGAFTIISSLPVIISIYQTTTMTLLEKIIKLLTPQPKPALARVPVRRNTK